MTQLKSKNVLDSVTEKIPLGFAADIAFAVVQRLSEERPGTGLQLTRRLVCNLCPMWYLRVF